MVKNNSLGNMQLYRQRFLRKGSHQKKRIYKDIGLKGGRGQFENLIF